MTIGPAIHYAPEELDALSQVTQADIEIAVALWVQYSPKRFRDLITGSNVYRWDTKQRKYYTGNFKYIDPLDLRNMAVEPFIQNVKIAMRSLSESLQAGTTTLQEWQTRMVYLIKYSELAVALVANGGTGNTTQNDLLTISAMILLLLLAHTKFAQEIESGAQPLNGLLLSRTGLYASASRDAYEEMTRAGVIAYGQSTLERRVLLEGANHCHTDKAGLPGCVELAAKGWQPIGTLPRLMDTPCRTNCLCHWEFM